MAAERGFDAIGTTLTISPYQFTEIIFQELERAAKARGLKALCQDYRFLYAQATRLSKEKGMYRQNYCGCRFSRAEAQAERIERKRQAAAAKALKHRALIWASAQGAATQVNQL